MTLKNLNYEASNAQKAELEKKVTAEFLINLLRQRNDLRDQVIIIIKQKFNKLELLSSSSKIDYNDLCK